MNTFKLLIVSALACPVMGYADSINGMFSISEPFSIHSPEGTYALNPGTYSAVADLNSQSISLSISGNGQFANVNVNSPNKSIPGNGMFSYNPAETGQVWGLNGNIITNEFDNPESQGWERCTLTRNEWVCRPYRGCGWEQVMYWGQRWVSFHDHFVNRQLQMYAVTDHPVAHFDGKSSVANRIYTNVGYCQ